MRKNLVLLTALSLGFAGIMTASTRTYHVTLAQNSIVEGQQLKAGNYKLVLNNDTATLRRGKQAVNVPAHAVTTPTKFANTEVEYVGNNMQKIDFGGTRTSIIFQNNTHAGASGGSGSTSGLR